eukprot:scaffold102393_cov17-Tisochrysis_lutea.AAC.1
MNAIWRCLEVQTAFSRRCHSDYVHSSAGSVSSLSIILVLFAPNSSQHCCSGMIRAQVRAMLCAGVSHNLFGYQGM